MERSGGILSLQVYDQFMCETTKKNSAEEEPWKSPEKNKKNEPLEQLKWTEPPERERPKNKPGEINTLEWKQLCRLLRKEPLNAGKPKK